MGVFVDMLGRKVEIPHPPRRIISVVPSQTELLFDLGLNETVVGITKFCIHPNEWFRQKTRVGGTKNLSIEKIISLAPDLIIANKEENTKEQIEQLAESFPVWISDIKKLDDALIMIERISEIVDQTQMGIKISAEIRASFNELKLNNASKKVAYFIWHNPKMSIGNDTFINDMIERIGWVNVISHKERYPIVSDEELCAAKPDIVLLSSEPFPFKDRHILEYQALLPEAEIILVDGELFSWYGSRLLQSVQYFQILKQKVELS